jgi:outer membrane translocation and assembly module TamA
VRLSARASVGFGPRWASPLGLLRFDLAWPVSRRPGEKRFRAIFTIGQAF